MHAPKEVIEEVNEYERHERESGGKCRGRKPNGSLIKKDNITLEGGGEGGGEGEGEVGGTLGPPSSFL